MIGSHCGQRMLPSHENRLYFKVKCAVCGAVFKQRKRQAKRNLKGDGSFGPVR